MYELSKSLYFFCSFEFEDFDDVLSFEGLLGRGIFDCMEVIFVDLYGDWSSWFDIDFGVIVWIVCSSFCVE